MTTRAAVIADLMTCLAGITVENGFAIAPKKLKRGIHLASQASETPALSLFNERVETIETGGDTAERMLVMHLWGAAAANQGDYAQLDLLAAACLTALARPDLNPHWQRTTAQRLEVFEGGSAEPLALFDLEFSLTYETALGVL